MSESFLSVMGLLRNMPVGNLLQAVSRPSWDYCVTIPQETFADSLLSGKGPMRDMPVGNPPQTVYCPAKDQCVTCQQETFGQQFPVRQRTNA